MGDKMIKKKITTNNSFLNFYIPSNYFENTMNTCELKKKHQQKTGAILDVGTLENDATILHVNICCRGQFLSCTYH